MKRVILPISSVLLLTMAGMGYYFWRVTGNPFRVPYQINMQTYGLLYFPWQRLPSTEFHHPVMRDFYLRYSIGPYAHSLAHPYEKVALGSSLLWLFFIGPVLMLPFFVWIAGKRFVSRKTRCFLAVCLFTAAGFLLPIHAPHPHYAAPLTAAVYALELQALRHARFWRWNKQPNGDVIVLAIPIICLSLFVVRAVLPVTSYVPVEPPPVEFVRTWSSPRFINLNRARVLKELTDAPGSHLVIVRYGAAHDVILNEWVYNEADIDHAKVVWAHEMSKEENRDLIHYFKDRHVWLCEADEKPAKMIPYPSD